MKFPINSSRVLILVAFLALFILPLTVALVGRNQENRTQAAPGTALSFDPASSEEEPISVASGNDVTLNLTVEPGEGNLVTFVKFVIDYDPAFFDIAEEDFQNSEAFPDLLEEPTIEDGRITGSVSVGNDPASAVSKSTLIGELTLHAKKATGDSPTTIAFAAESEVLSIGDNDDVNENVLSTTGAAIITVENGSQTPAKDEKKETPSTRSGPTSPPPDNVTTITLSALLHGVGSAGDSVNPKNSSLSNKEPLHKSRATTVAILDENGEDIARTDGELIFNDATGKFNGQFTMDTFVTEGNYIILVLTDSYLPFEKDITIGDNNVVDMGEVSFVAGDIVPDGKLDILDYNALSDCGYGAGSALPMDDPDSIFQSEACQKIEYPEFADLDDNGIIDSRDFNLFLRELSAQKVNN